MSNATTTAADTDHGMRALRALYIMGGMDSENLARVLDINKNAAACWIWALDAEGFVQRTLVSEGPHDVYVIELLPAGRAAVQKELNE